MPRRTGEDEPAIEGEELRPLVGSDEGGGGGTELHAVVDVTDDAVDAVDADAGAEVVVVDAAGDGDEQVLRLADDSAGVAAAVGDGDGEVGGAVSVEEVAAAPSGGDGGGAGPAGGEASPQASSSSPPAPAPVERTEEQREALKAKLTAFYQKYNPEMLDEPENLDRILSSPLTDQRIFRMLYEKYVRGAESDSDCDAHPKIAPSPGERRPPAAAKRLTQVPRGGDKVARKFSDNTMALLVPVSITMFVVMWAVTNFTPINENSRARPIYLAYTGSPGDSTAEKFGGALLNAVIVVVFFFVVTTVIVVLYKMGCMKVIQGWLILSSGTILYLMGFIWFDLFMTKYQLPYDWLTAAVIILNFGTVGVCSIYFYGHPKMAQAYLVATAAIMAWFLSRLPEWTTWVLLALVALYDIAAVLTPKGPLKALVEEAEKRNEPIPGLIYESKTFKLGLGDFVFYSVLVGRAAAFNYLNWAVSFLAVLSGLCGTLTCLGYAKRALPALPISIFLGIAFHFSTRFVLLPYEGDTFLTNVAY